MKVGASTIDITPEAGCELSGYLSRVQPSIGVHDPLFARCLYLSEGEEQLLWVHADLVGFERDFVQDLKAQIHRHAGVAPKRVIVSATHTHSGPATIRLIKCGEYDEKYVAWLRPRLLTAARQAVERTEEAQLLVGEGRCDLAVDRRARRASVTDAEGQKQVTAHTDPRLAVFAWRREDGTYPAVLANYAVHNVAAGETLRRYISADIYGQAAAAVGEHLPGHPVVLFTNGACGNLNPPEQTDDFDRIAGWGKRLADGAADTLATAPPIRIAALRTVSIQTDVPLDVFDEAQIQARADALRKEIEDQTGYSPDRYREAIAIWQRSATAKVRNRTAAKSVPVELQVIRLADKYLVCLPAEVFSRMPHELSRATGRDVYVVGYANGLIGYLPTAEAYAEGGYEVDSAFVFYGTSRTKLGTFEALRDQAVELIRTM